MLHGIFIGIDRYADSRIRPLACAARDARSVHDAFSRIEERERNVVLLTDQQATRSAILSTVGEDIARVATPDDLVVVYFAGHGSPETEASPDEASRFLVTHDADFARLYSSALDMDSELRRWFGRLASQYVVFVVDACFSGKAGGRTFEGPMLRQRRGQFRAAEPISLAPLDLGQGRIVLTACRDDELAREDSSLGNGLFTHCLLEVLERHAASPAIGIGTLYDEVSAAVRKLTSGQQRPVLKGESQLLKLPILPRKE